MWVLGSIALTLFAVACAQQIKAKKESKAVVLVKKD